MCRCNGPEWQDGAQQSVVAILHLARLHPLYVGSATFDIRPHAPSSRPQHLNTALFPARSTSIAIMELTALTLINVQTLLISISVVILSVLDFYFTGHALNTFGRWFPPGTYEWQNPGQRYMPPTGPAHKVQLIYDYSPENMILVSAALSIIAGLFGIAGFWFARKVRLQSSHLLLIHCADIRPATEP